MHGIIDTTKKQGMIRGNLVRPAGAANFGILERPYEFFKPVFRAEGIAVKKNDNVPPGFIEKEIAGRRYAPAFAVGIETKTLVPFGETCHDLRGPVRRSVVQNHHLEIG